jgi:hypothetical protein
MKGQSAVFELVLLFGIAVAIFVIAFGIFQLYQDYYTSTALLDHTKTVKDVVYNHIVELTKFGGLNASFTLKIPEELGSEYYFIRLNDAEIRVETYDSGVAAVSSLAALSSGSNGYSFSGETSSSRGEIIIYKRGHNIIIG